MFRIGDEGLRWRAFGSGCLAVFFCLLLAPGAFAHRGNFGPTSGRRRAQALHVSIPASRGARSGRHLYLLAGTPTIYSTRGFPVRLYSVSGGRLVLVRQVAAGLTSVADDLAGHLYVLNYAETSVSVIHENSPEDVDVVPAPPSAKGGLRWFNVSYSTWGAVAGPGVSPSAVFVSSAEGRWVVTQIFAHAPSAGPRVARGSWDLYRNFRYEGGWPFQQFVPGGSIVRDGVCMMRGSPGSCMSVLGPTPHFLPSEAGAFTDTVEDSTGKHTVTSRGAAVVVDTAHFFAFNAPMPNSKLMPPRTVYILNKSTGRWSALKLPFRSRWPRLFGAWLATTVQEPNPEGRVSPGLENERAHQVNVDTPAGVVWELPRVRGRYHAIVFMPGKLLLRNLVDGRKITINTGQQDSEILDVRKDGLVLYRVNDEIFSAQIEGDKISAQTLVVKGEDVPEVHWAFWSSAPAKPAHVGKSSAGR